MIRGGLLRTFLAATLVAASATVAAAQEDPVTPEGIEWHLVGYGSDGGLQAVPWDVEATLSLEDGAATGSNGCNTFDAGYVLEGQDLTFEAPIAVTEMACAGAASSVEQGYMGNLPTTATWAIDDGSLELADLEGSVVLAYERVVLGLTATDIAVLRLLIDDPSSEPAISFDLAEQILLEGVPDPIRATCQPRRSDNPGGTVAAVQCTPDTPIVADLTYSLMSGDAATAAFDQTMRENGVKQGGLCRRGRPVLAIDVPGPGAEGCYVDAEERANLRAIVPAAGCSQLPVGESSLEIPAIYVTVLGADSNIRKLARWAEPKRGRSILTTEIQRPDAPLSPRCPS